MAIQVFGINCPNYHVFSDSLYGYMGQVYICPIKYFEEVSFLEHCYVIKTETSLPRQGAKVFDTGNILSDVMVKNNFILCKNISEADYIIPYGSVSEELYKCYVFVDHIHKNLIVSRHPYYPKYAIGEDGILLEEYSIPHLIPEEMFVVTGDCQIEQSLPYLGRKKFYKGSDILKASETNPEYDLTPETAISVMELLKSPDPSNYTIGIDLLMSSNIYKFKESVTYILYSLNPYHNPPLLGDFIGPFHSDRINKKDWKVLKAIIKAQGFKHPHFKVWKDRKYFRFINIFGFIRYGSTI